MTTCFVFRSHYCGPTDKYIRRFDDPTVQDSFRTHWEALAAPQAAAFDRAREVLGTDVYGFASLDETIAERGLEVPQTPDELWRALDQHLYDPHCIQVLTDDDELELAYYFFDDEFLKAHGERATYLLYDKADLPSGELAEPARLTPSVNMEQLDQLDGAGELWICLATWYVGASLTERTPRIVRRRPNPRSP